MKDFVVNIQHHKLSATIHGFAAPKDGDYLIVVNEDDTEEQQRETVLHEMLHIMHNDFDKSGSVELIELERHEELLEILQQERSEQ